MEGSLKERKIGRSLEKPAAKGQRSDRETKLHDGHGKLGHLAIETSGSSGMEN